MFFSKLGRIIALAIFSLGTIRLATALFVASIDDIEQRTAATLRYLGHGTTGAIIDRCQQYILVAVVVGILAEVSLSIRNRTNSSS